MFRILIKSSFQQLLISKRKEFKFLWSLQKYSKYGTSNLTFFCLCCWDRVSLLSPWAVLELTRLNRLAFWIQRSSSLCPHSPPRTVPQHTANWAFSSTLLPFQDKCSTTPSKTELKTSAFNSIYYKNHRKKNQHLKCKLV